MKPRNRPCPSSEGPWRPAFVAVFRIYCALGAEGVTVTTGFGRMILNEGQS
jgi:hypothetical protein